MALRSFRCRHLQRITRAWPNNFSVSGIVYQECGVNAGISASSSGASICPSEQILANFPGRDFYAQRFSVVAEKSQGCTNETDLMSFIMFALDQPKGPHHFWLNRAEESKVVRVKDGIFLLLMDDLLSGSESLVGVQTAKFLQQRYPGLYVFALQRGLSVSDDSSQSLVLHLIIEEYINFPILLTNKTFPETLNGPRYMLFKDFESCQIFHEKDMELDILQNAIKDLHEERGKTPSSFVKLKSPWSKPIELSKEPSIGSFMRNLLLYFPACICEDESRGRFFLSDSHHHRIIIFDGSGKILDSIGSSPGFEDGDFENAKLLRPAGSFYQVSDNSLYFVDSENHAIRRADMEKRVVDTLYPNSKEKDKGGLWKWIRTKFGMNIDINVKSDEFDAGLLMFPWQLIKLEDQSLLILNSSYSCSWIMNLHTGGIENVIKGSQNILETYGQQIGENTPVLESLPQDSVQHLIQSTEVSDNTSPSHMSSFAMCGNKMLLCDKVCHRVLALDMPSGVVSKFQFSNFGVLGLPYWLLRSLEKVYSAQSAYGEVYEDHYESFTLLPGRVNIQLNIDIPADTELVEPLQEGCIWRQARGAAVVVSEVESIETFDEKVGVSQQWYDELDNLAFATEAEASQEEAESDRNNGVVQDDKIRIDCVVNTSPGTCEVIVYAALYLRLKKDSNMSDLDREKKAAILADTMKPKSGDKSSSEERDAFIQMLANSSNNLDDLIFMKPLHVKIKLNTLDHTKNENTRSVVSTDSSIEVDVSL